MCYVLINVNRILLLLGCIMDPIVGELIVMPILIPIAIFFEIDLIHLGVISVLNAMIGLSTPPYGEKEMWPFLAVLIGVLLACTYIPGIVLWLPKLAGYVP